MISYNLMWNKSYLIFILNNYRYDNYLNSNRYNKLNNYSYDNYLNFNRYNELNVSEGHICNFLHIMDATNWNLAYKTCICQTE
jgi:hypothetical protein